ncbi:Crp/Fnr family transcriptional regulator [Novosphingobium sp. 9U]|uniref:Crp/Fnr family transcriptional regulator n=1 Tax=Novosphingobium sp. 9U TaxID=2653158 RepID=UPI00135BF3FF|nr:Crp/Fnr family transcriptional regulator [Novosphingobium sp. 9U]
MLTREEEKALLDLPCHAAQVRANEDFVRLGEHVDHACLIVDGLVGRFDQNHQGSRQITAIHVPGDMADLHSVVQPQATSALQALSVATIVRIPHKAIRAATAAHPALAEALWRDCMVDAAILAQWVVNVGRRDARSRLAHLFCEIATRLEANIGSASFRFPFHVTQAQLADATGLTLVHVNRTLRVLREEGLAEVTRHEVRVLDWEGLAAAGDFQTDYLQRDSAIEERLRIVPPVDQLVRHLVVPGRVPVSRC